LTTRIALEPYESRIEVKIIRHRLENSEGV